MFDFSPFHFHKIFEFLPSELIMAYLQYFFFARVGRIEVIEY